MKSFYLLPLGLALMTASCKSTKTASTNPYQNNPYYSTSSTTTDYSSTTPSSTYPTYTQNTYTPPTTAPTSAPNATVPSVPSVPTYNQPTYTTPTSQPSPSLAYTGSGNKSHTVASGENLYRISQKHGTSIAAIKSANGLSGDMIRAGQTLVIP